MCTVTRIGRPGSYSCHARLGQLGPRVQAALEVRPGAELAGELDLGGRGPGDDVVADEAVEAFPPISLADFLGLPDKAARCRTRGG